MMVQVCEAWVVFFFHRLLLFQSFLLSFSRSLIFLGVSASTTSFPTSTSLIVASFLLHAIGLTSGDYRGFCRLLDNSAQRFGRLQGFGFRFTSVRKHVVFVRYFAPCVSLGGESTAHRS